MKQNNERCKSIEIIAKLIEKKVVKESELARIFDGHINKLREKIMYLRLKGINIRYKKYKENGKYKRLYYIK